MGGEGTSRYVVLQELFVHDIYDRGYQCLYVFCAVRQSFDVAYMLSVLIVVKTRE